MLTKNIQRVKHPELLLVLQRLGIEDAYDKVMSRDNTKFIDDELVSLDFSNLDINSIPKGIFDAFPGLIYLDLSKNKIFNISSGTFKYNRSLRYLNLSNNNIRELPLGSLQNLSVLEVLSLSENQLVRIDHDFFTAQNIFNLRVLNLSNNLLQEIPDSINDLDNLEEFNLANNPIL